MIDYKKEVSDLYDDHHKGTRSTLVRDQGALRCDYCEDIWPCEVFRMATGFLLMEEICGEFDKAIKSWSMCSKEKSCPDCVDNLHRAHIKWNVFEVHGE